MPSKHPANSIICQMIQRDVQQRPEMIKVVQRTKRPKIRFPIYLTKQTNLHREAMSGSVEKVGKIIELNVNVDLDDEDGWTALIYAAVYGHVKVVEMLLVAGADANAATNQSRKTSLMKAARYGHVEVVKKLLLQTNVNFNAADAKGRTALSLAEIGGYDDIIKILREARAV